MDGVLPVRRSLEARLLRQGRVVAAAANALEASVRARADGELRKSVDQLRAGIGDGADVPALLPEAAALVRETARRVLGFRLDDEQIVGGVALHHGALVEMKTGEGKTATVLLPAFLAASAGEPVHVMTADDHLVRRDEAGMRPVLERLGLSCASVRASERSGPTLASRRACYAADVVYGTVDAFADEHLRDQLAWTPEETVARGRWGRAIVDEADAALIDEAHMLFTITRGPFAARFDHVTLTRILDRLRSGVHYVVDERRRRVTLTDRGTARLEDQYGVADLNDAGGPALVQAVDAALQAREFYRRGRAYQVRDGAIAVIDGMTGRLVDSGALGQGVLQAIAAKEGLTVPPLRRRVSEIQEYAFLRGYRHLAGLTGVAEETEAYRRVYGLEVVHVPTVRPVLRVDHPVRMYGTGEQRLEGAVRLTVRARAAGRPVLLGTASEAQAEEVSAALAERGVPHEVLVAGDRTREAEAIGRAGRAGQVTVVTKTVGRGVDIPLGGAGASRADHDAVVRSGGLLVIALDLFESSRLERHMRGRAGRRGDPGESEVLASLDDPTLTSMLSRYSRRTLASLTGVSGEPFVSAASSRELERNLARRNALQAERLCVVVLFGDVQAEQTAELHRLRTQTRDSGETAEAEEVPDWVRQSLEGFLRSAVGTARSASCGDEAGALHAELARFYPVGLTVEELAAADPDPLPRVLADIQAAHRRREKELTAPLVRALERRIRLSAIDRAWPDHLDRLRDLCMEAPSNTLPGGDLLAFYRTGADRLFAELWERVDREFVQLLFGVKVVVEQEDEGGSSDAGS